MLRARGHFPANSLPVGSVLQERRPGRVGPGGGCFRPLLVTASDVDGVNLRLPAAALLEKHQHTAVRRPGRTFRQKAVGKDSES